MNPVSLKKVSLLFCAFLYIAAGINHFWNPSFYLRIIPPYFPDPVFINHASGFFELLFGLLLIPRATRRFAAICIVLMLFAFIPAHIYTVQIACPGSTGCRMQWLTWLRLVLIQPLLIAWAWSVRK